MAVDLFEHVDSLKREVTPPGSTLFSDVSDETWVGYMTDGFWEARLDGFLTSYTADAIEGTISPLETGGEEIGRDKLALVILYASVKVLRNHIMNLNMRFRAEAGSVSFAVDNSATVLREILAQLQATKQRILDAPNQQTTVALIDAYATRLSSPESYGVPYSSDAPLFPGAN